MFPALYISDMHMPVQLTYVTSLKHRIQSNPMQILSVYTDSYSIGTDGEVPIPVPITSPDLDHHTVFIGQGSDVVVYALKAEVESCRSPSLCLLVIVRHIG